MEYLRPPADKVYYTMLNLYYDADYYIYSFKNYIYSWYEATR